MPPGQSAHSGKRITESRPAGGTEGVTICMEASKQRELALQADRIRLGVLEGTHAASSGHPGGSLSIADILSYLYFYEMRIDPENPAWEDRDRLVLSKGHAAPALYAALALRGYFPVSELKNLRKIDSILQGHPDMKHIPGVDMSSGSLGQGISAACGMALAGQLNGKTYRVYTIIGDGESEEGEVWEALMFAARYNLDNLCVVIDYNGLQIDGPIDRILAPAPYEKKLEGFGAHVISMDAHDFGSIRRAFDEAKTVSGKPSVIIAHSVKGKGVSFMENQVKWHGSAPNDEQYAQAVAEINAHMEQL